MKINPCPFCDHVDVEWCEPELGTYAIDCPECQCIGPFADSPEVAAEKWNKSGQQERTRAAVLTEMCHKHEREIERLRLVVLDFNRLLLDKEKAVA
jgi:hypothetical protein